MDMNSGTLKALLVKQMENYPKTQIQDMVKFIYHNEYAGGKVITDEEDSLKQFKEAYAKKTRQVLDRPVPYFEEIGNGLCRFNLRALRSIDIRMETVNRFFVTTANTVMGTVRDMEDKLDVLRQCCIGGELPFPVEEVEAYLENYRAGGYPSISHSQEYKAAYKPWYCIIKSEYMEYYNVFRKIDMLLKMKDRVNIAIDGNSGSGKSKLSLLISYVYDSNLFHMDDFFLQPQMRTPERLAEIGGNVDYVRFKEEVIDGLESGEAFQYDVYDCAKMAMIDRVDVTPKRVNIIEGSYSMHPTLVKHYDLKIFMQVDADEQTQRILKRNGAKMLEQFVKVWIPMENRYFNEQKVAAHCDLVYGSIEVE